MLAFRALSTEFLSTLFSAVKILICRHLRSHINTRLSISFPAEYPSQSILPHIFQVIGRTNFVAFCAPPIATFVIIRPKQDGLTNMADHVESELWRGDCIAHG